MDDGFAGTEHRTQTHSSIVLHDTFAPTLGAQSAFDAKVNSQLTPTNKRMFAVGVGANAHCDDIEINHRPTVVHIHISLPLHTTTIFGEGKQIYSKQPYSVVASSALSSASSIYPFKRTNN